MRRAQFSPGFYSTITELLEEPVDVPGSPFGCSAIDCNWDGLPTPLATSSVQDRRLSIA
jgi:hypothetical protein